MDVQWKIREAKQRELDERYKKIEVLQSRFVEFNDTRKVRAVTGKFKRITEGKLVNSAGGLIVNTEGIKGTWKKQFSNERRPTSPFRLTRDLIT